MSPSPEPREGHAPRIGPEKAWEMVQEEDALLICSYDDEDKCSDISLPGSVSLNELLERDDSLSKDRRLVFY